MSIDRTFIDKYDSFIFTIRRVMYYGDTNIKMQPTNPKHDRWRFINFFGFEMNHEYYDSDNDTFDFDNDNKLKDEFANTYCYKSINITQMGDLLHLFVSLNDREQTAEQLSGSRNKKNINRRLESNEELIQSGSVISHGKNKKTYTKNIQISKGIENKKKFVEALDFAIKKNNFSAFASTYKRMYMCRDGVENQSCGINFSDQLFHPILDEKHIWELLSAILEREKIDIEHCNSNVSLNELTTIKDIIPLKLLYDAQYGRSYLICTINSEISAIRIDRIFSIKATEKFDEDDFNKSLMQANELLKTAWTVCLSNKNIQHVVLRFINNDYTKTRVAAEGRHGKITKCDNDYFTYEVDVNDFTEMTNWILSFASSCKVIAPQNLIDYIINHLEEMAK